MTMVNPNLVLQNMAENPDFDFINQFNFGDDNDFNFSDSPYQSSNFNCTYVDPLSYKLTFVKDAIRIMSLNIQSIQSKFNDLRDLIFELENDNCAPDIICLQELWQFPDFKTFSLPNYAPLCYKLRNVSQGGGIGIYVRSNLKFNVLPNVSIFIDRILESLFIELFLPNKQKIVIGSIYRPGSTHPNLTQLQAFNEFIDLFSNLCDNLTNKKTDLILTGDFNIDILKYNSNSRASDYIDILFSFGLLQLVTKPTRCNDNSATLIDHFVTNIPLHDYMCDILTSRISDHFPIIFSLPYTHKTKDKPKFVRKRIFNTSNENRFKETLNNISWNSIREDNDVQSAYNTFSDTFTNLFDIHFPYKTFKFNRNHHKIDPWITKGLLISRKNKLRLASNHAKNPNELNKTTFNSYRNLYNRFIKAAKRKYFDDQFQKNIKNLKKTWELIRTAVDPNTNFSNPISELFCNGIKYTTPSEIANQFNIFLHQRLLKLLVKSHMQSLLKQNLSTILLLVLQIIQ
jgi:hypothetical protein